MFPTLLFSDKEFDIIEDIADVGKGGGAGKYSISIDIFIIEEQDQYTAD